MAMHYAHSLAGEPPDSWEPLARHLHEVAKLTGEFAGKFGARDWGEVLGLWHDLGKYSEAFQNYLKGANGLEAHLEAKPGKVDHSTAGAKHAFEAIRPWGRLLAYIIAGHHAGLADSTAGPASLQGRLQKAVDRLCRKHVVLAKQLSMAAA